MTQILFLRRFFALITIYIVMAAVNAKILQMDIPSTSARGPFPARSTAKELHGKEKRERILGDGTFTLGYSTRFTNFGGFGGYPGLGYYGYSHGHGNHGFYPSLGLGYGQYYDPYFSKPFHHHHHHGGAYSGGFGFKHHYHHQGGYHNHFGGYPGFY